ncbi:hypothetical protein OOJ91_33975 [Micromonospora lupini]|uniref:hypothetical protein n=1 Tax=Micromonospora lupini TaxID=285679 RepID=UPI002256B6F0|nr:hypothetical protein [Micromonospora lupini]MCX5070857.1 hypothetical protein [Micromonospora lupini]
MEIVGMIIAVVLLTGLTVGAVNGTTKAGKAVVANRKAASAARKEARADRKPLPDAEPAPAGVKAGQVAAGLLYGAALYGRAGWAGAKVGWDAGRDATIDWWERRKTPLAEDIDLGVTPEDYLAGKRPTVPAQKPAPTPTAPTQKPTVEDEFAKIDKWASAELRLAAESAVHDARKQGYGPGDVEKAALGIATGRHGSHWSQATLAKAIREVLTGEQAKPTKPNLRLVADNTQTHSGGKPMAVHTVTGGEVVNTETGLLEAQAKLKRSTTEFEDATADYARAREEFAVDERFAASVGSLDFPQNIKNAAATCMEASRLRATSAQQRMTAAESAMNAARRLVTLFQGHHDLATRAAELGGMAKQGAYSS